MPLIALRQAVNYLLEKEIFDINNSSAVYTLFDDNLDGGKHQLTAAANQCKNSIQKSLRRIGTINLRFSRRIGKFGKRLDSAKFLKLINSFYYKLHFNPVTSNSFKNSKKGYHEQIQLS